jgi:recombination protein RecA
VRRKGRKQVTKRGAVGKLAVSPLFLEIIMAKREKDAVAVVDARAARIALICGNINKTPFGGDKHDAVTWLGSREGIQMERFPSGDMGLDEALGGGWPRGRFIEVFGPESGGKTTLVLHAIAEFQRKYPEEDCALIDTEYTFDEFYAGRIGVNTKYLIVHQPDGGEQALNVLKLLVQQGVKCIVVDSVAALTTKAEREGDIGDAHVGEQARLMSQALRQLAAECGKNDATVFWTNQMRDKIGVMWGEKTTTPAGKALPYYSSIRAFVVAIGKVREGAKEDSIVVCSKNKVSVRKNKTAAPFKEAEFCISFGYGIDRIAAILDMAIEMKVITKRGSWFAMGVEQLGQGRKAVLDMMRVDEARTKQIEDAVKAAKDAGVKPEVAPDVEKVDNGRVVADVADEAPEEEGAEAQDV